MKVLADHRRSHDDRLVALRAQTLRIGIIVIAGAGLFAAFQNCGQGFQSSTLGSSPSPETEGPTPVGRSTEVYEGLISRVRGAESSLNPQTSETVSPVLTVRGSCLIRGGAGKYLSRIDFTDRTTCSDRCATFGATYPNRVCTWKGIGLFGDPPQLCRVVGGGNVELSSATVAADQCTSMCDQYKNTDPYRTCDWGGDRFVQPAADAECRVVGGAGKMLSPTTFSTFASCQAVCASYSTSVYRTCRYGGQIFRAPDASARCDVWGGAGKVLSPAFFGSPSDCRSRCDSFLSNVNRMCWYGKMRIQ